MHQEPFRFFTERRLVQLTGLRARGLDELAVLLREVPGSCVFYHTHQAFLTHHFETPVVPNDFSIWVGEALREDALAEQLAAIDLTGFTSIHDVRLALLGKIEAHPERSGSQSRPCPPGEEFHFCRSKSFILSTGVVAVDVPGFFQHLPDVANTSLYFHMMEARLRLGRRTNDFSEWLTGRGAPELASAIEALDPYAVTLDELKAQIAAIGGVK